MYDKTGSISMADYRPSLTGSAKPVRVELLFSGITASGLDQTERGFAEFIL